MIFWDQMEYVKLIELLWVIFQMANEMMNSRYNDHLPKYRLNGKDIYIMCDNTPPTADYF